MDVFERDGGVTTADTVHRREEFRQIVADVQELPETQRTALLLREIDALSYDQIAEAMDTTVPSVKSLLVRARVALAEAAEARLLTCDEVRLELGRVAEGIARSTPPVRRHLKTCDRCRTFRTELRSTNKALAAIYPVGPLLDPEEALGREARARRKRRRGRRRGQRRRRRGRRSGRGRRGRRNRRRPTAGGFTASSVVSAGVSAIASKAAAGTAAAVIVTAGAVEVKHVAHPAAAARRPGRRGAAPSSPPSRPRRSPAAKPKKKPAKVTRADVKPKPDPAPVVAPPRSPRWSPPRRSRRPRPRSPADQPVQEEGSTAVLPPRADEDPAVGPPDDEPTDTQTTTDGATTTPAPPTPAPPAGEPGAGATAPPPPPLPPVVRRLG